MAFQQMHLRPTTSSLSLRYGKSVKIRPDYTAVPAGPSTTGGVLSTLPPGWTPYVHPEGQPYFSYAGTPRILTDAYLYRRENQARITVWISIFNEKLSLSEMVVSDTMEALLELDESDPYACGYYLIDHATRTQFWLEDLEADELGLSPSVGPSHLSLALEDLYWTHVEYFPMHFGGLPPQALDDLLTVFLHGQIDRMTSDQSTFPYTSDECSKFVEILHKSRGIKMNGYMTCYVARLWSVILSTRHVTHYGQESCRLNRNQEVLEAPAATRPWLNVLFSRLSCGVSEKHRRELELLYVDEVIYIDQWRRFQSSCIEEWKTTTSRALLLLIASLLLMFLPSSSRIIAFACLALSAIAILASLLLSMRHESLKEADAGVAARYLHKKRSASLGYIPASLVLGVPKTSLLWGCALVCVQLMYMVYPHVHPYVAIGAAVLCSAVVCLYSFSKLQLWRHPTAEHNQALERDAPPEYVFSEKGTALLSV